MWKLPSRYKTKADQELAQIEAQVHNATVRHFEGNQNILLKLPFEEYFDLLIEYSNALSAMGKSKKYIATAEELIHYIFEKNIAYYKAVDILQFTLFKKALAHYHLHQYNESIHILRELLKMNPKNEAYRRLCHQCLYKLSIKGDTHFSRSFFLFLVFVYAAMVGFELLLINSRFPNISVGFELVRWSVFILALIIFLIGESRHHFMTWLRLRREVMEFQRHSALKQTKMTIGRREKVEEAAIQSKNIKS